MVSPIAAPPPPPAPLRAIVFDTGSEQCPQGQLPGPLDFTPQEASNAANPLQYVPVVGMLYRQATGETIPPPMQIAGSIASGAVLGGPAGVLGAVLLNFVLELGRLGADTSRPPVPAGMDVTGSEAGIRSVTPGSLAGGEYTTLATVVPDFLGGGTAFASNSPAARQVIAAYEAGTMTGAG